MTTQTIRLLHTASSKSDLTTLVNTADAEISKMIVECSDRILLQGQIRWKEDNFKFPDCILTPKSGIIWIRGGRNATTMYMVMVDLVVTKT
jgi:hypothetical protein